MQGGGCYDHFLVSHLLANHSGLELMCFSLEAAFGFGSDSAVNFHRQPQLLWL